MTGQRPARCASLFLVVNALLVAAFLHSTCLAQDKPVEPDKNAVTELSKSLHDYFSGISSIAFRSSLQYTLDSKLVKPNTYLGPQTGTLSLDRWGDKYVIDDRMDTGPQAEKHYRVFAYNGERYQVLDVADSLLWMKTLKPADPKPEMDQLRFDDFFLQTFEFCSPGLDAGYESGLDFRDFKTEDYFAVLSRKITSIRLPGAADADLEVTISAGVDAFSKQPVSYVVEFSPREGYFPRGWRRMDKSGRVLASLDVTDVGTYTDAKGFKFNYPAKIRYCNYGGTRLDPVQTVPVFTKEVSIMNFRVNFPEPDDDPFTLDAGVVNAVRDADNNVTIAVPR